MATVRITRSKLRQALLSRQTAMRDEAEKELRDVAAELKLWHEQVVEDWEHKPRFEIDYDIGQYQIVFRITPTGRYAAIWKYVNEGTEPHQIYPRLRGGKLTFRTAYTAKTAPVAKVNSGGGRASGEWRSTEVVNHPGSEARLFTEEFEKRLRPDFRRRMENAIRRGARRS